MELMPTVCPKCGDRMSTPIPGKRTGLLIATCRNGECLYTERSATAQVADAFKPAPAADHARMFQPNTARPEPPRVAGALERFEKAWMQRTLARELAKTRKTAAAAAAIDPKLKQLGEGDR
jgi:hypothetical protein